MKIALVHDWLNQKQGGAEKVLDVFAQMYPEAPIYTLIYNRELFEYPSERIRTSYLQKAPNLLKQRSRYLLPLIPSAVESWDFGQFDLVLSSSSAFVKNIITPQNTRHICYCHTPMRFVWDYWPKYLEEQRVGPVRRAYIRRQVRELRTWDYIGASRVDLFLANSNTTSHRIKKYYQKESSVVYPPVETKIITPDKKEDYYVTLGMLTPYKKIDLAIEAFNISGKKLRIIGDGPDRSRLEAMAADNIEFLGFVDAAEKDRVLSRAKGLIFPNMEDFGIAPVEAMACGTPVIAFESGGVTETVTDNETGIFFNTQTPKDLNAAVERADQFKFDTSRLHERARQFNRQQFEQTIRKHVEATN